MRFVRVAAGAALAVVSCGAPRGGVPSPSAPPGSRSGAATTAQSDTTPRGAVVDYVIVISIDGLRPDAIQKYDAKVMSKLMAEGAASLEARTVYPSTTLPSHTSMLTGLPPESHGVTWNDDRTSTRGTVGVPTVFELASAAGFTAAAFFSKPKLNHLVKPGTLEYVGRPRGSDNLLASTTIESATRYLKRRRPNVVFVHIAEPDYAGHSAGWMSTVYGWAVRRADGAVGRLLDAADVAYGVGNYAVILTADHGGHGRTHGTESEPDATIPWIAWGVGVEQGVLKEPVSTMDTAATVLWLLGVTAPGNLIGRPVTSAYTEAARVAAGAVR